MIKSNIFFIAISVIFLISCLDKRNKDVDEFTPLFNGKDLTGWNPKVAGHELGENFGNTFSVKDSLLIIRYDNAVYDSFDNQFGALYTNKVYRDFHFKAVYRFVGNTCPGAPEWAFKDGGIQFHGQDPATMTIDQSFPVCLEFNLHGGNGKDKRPVGALCANGMFVDLNGEQNPSYCNPPLISRTFYDDQWITLEITSKDGQFAHFINGEKILEYNNSRYDPENELAKSLIKDSTNLVVNSGYISIQSNGHPMDFKSVEIKEL